MSEPCVHPGYEKGLCTGCGRPCEHDIILNGACYHCGSVELDGVSLSPKPPEQLKDQLIPATRLTRPGRESK